MKVVIIHTDFRIYWPARLAALHSYLEKYNIELHIVEIAGAGSPYAFAKQEKEVSSKLNWHILFPNGKMEELESRVIKKQVDRILDILLPDVVIAGAIAFPSGALSVAWTSRHKCKMICFDDSRLEDTVRSSWVNKIKQCIYHGVDAMLYPAPAWDNTGYAWEFKKEQLFYGIDVVDNTFWKPKTWNKNTCDKKYFLSVGRLLERKNFITLLKAYKQYKIQCNDSAWNLIIVGDGPKRESLVEYIRLNKLERSVILLPFLQQKDLIPFYQNASALVLTSIQETWGLVINEAMASGLPIIVSDKCGAASTLVEKGRNGYTFSPLSESDLADCLLNFYKLSDERRNEMRKASLELIADWGIERFCSGVYGAIQYVVHHPKKKLSWIDSVMIALWKGRYRPM